MSRKWIPLFQIRLKDIVRNPENLWQVLQPPVPCGKTVTARALQIGCRDFTRQEREKSQTPIIFVNGGNEKS